jgi:hypothetical protein
MTIGARCGSIVTRFRYGSFRVVERRVRAGARGGVALTSSTALQEPATCWALGICAAR